MSGSWRTDPTGRHLYRYHDGDGWTDHVADGGAAGTDPYDGPPSPTPPGPVPSSSPTSRTSDGPTGTSGGPSRTNDDSDPGDSNWSRDAGTAGSTGTTGAGGPSRSPSPSGPTGPAGPAGGTSWPTGPAPAAGGGGGWDPGGSQSFSGDGGGRSGWSTGAKIGAAAGVLGLMLVAGAIGFGMGVASNVATGLGDIVTEEFEEGFEDGGFIVDRALPGDAAQSGVVLSSDNGFFDGTIDGSTVFGLSVTRQSFVRIEIAEGDFDTYLLLYDDQDQLIAENDDGGNELLSVLDLELEPGQYFVVVDSFSGGVDSSEAIVLEATFDTVGG